MELKIKQKQQHSLLHITMTTKKSKQKVHNSL